MENFSNFLKVYFRNHLLDEDKNIKVAVIDDGVNLDHRDVRDNIAGGETFHNNNGHWQGFYQSSNGHGTLMAKLICQICPKVKLYVAKLNEEWVNSSWQITAASAADAIFWAVDQKVDIISMSWSIDQSGENKIALREAVESAVKREHYLVLRIKRSREPGEPTSIPR
jgi:subtilisin family serine protease